jgi:hypothetical protein
MIKVEIDNKKPNADELEITLIGAGCEAGESVVVHLANGKWIIIDSCKSDGEVLPLYYLRKKKVNLDIDVCYVICTHWHTDHITGLSEVVGECKNAILAIPSFFNSPKVFEALFEDYVNRKSPIVKEMYDSLSIIKERKGVLRQPIFLGPRDEITGVEIDGVKVEVRSFSPADHAKELYDKMLASSTLHNVAASDLETNMCSSVLDITTNNHLLSVLLGADLECNRKEGRNLDCKTLCDENFQLGWCNVIKCNKKYGERNKYNYIKAAHHSSINGYCPELMDTKVDKEQTFITTTVFENGAGIRLPEEQMLRKYQSICDNYYITASHPKPLPVKDERSVIEDMKNKGVQEVKVVKPECGMITTRYNITTGARTSHELQGCASKVNEELILRFA